MSAGYWIPSLASVEWGGPHSLWGEPDPCDPAVQTVTLVAQLEGASQRLVPPGIDRLAFSARLVPWTGGWIPPVGGEGVLVPTASKVSRVVWQEVVAWASEGPSGGGDPAGLWGLKSLLARLGSSGLPAFEASEARRELLATVEADLSDPDLEVARWAGRIGLHPDTLTRRVKEQLGVTPVEWIHLRRVALAIRLLGRPGFGRGRVAAEAGFRSVRDFHRVFLAVTGVTPGRYQKKDPRIGGGLAEVRPTWI